MSWRTWDPSISMRSSSLAAAGLDIAEVSYDRRLYAAYTCVKPA